MSAGPFMHIAGNVAAKQITFAALKGLSLAGLFGFAYKMSIMDSEHKRINVHYDALALKK